MRKLSSTNPQACAQARARNFLCGLSLDMPDPTHKTHLTPIAAGSLNLDMRSSRHGRFVWSHYNATFVKIWISGFLCISSCNIHIHQWAFATVQTLIYHHFVIILFYQFAIVVPLKSLPFSLYLDVSVWCSILTSYEAWIIIRMPMMQKWPHCSNFRKMTKLLLCMKIKCLCAMFHECSRIYLINIKALVVNLVMLNSQKCY